MARLSDNGIRLSALSPTYLDTNSTSHTWPFSAVAELVDNACDPGVCAKQMWIDVTEIKNELCLTFTDNGNGMTPINLHKMLSFGFTSKTGTRKHLPIGMYGNGFKSGSMRLGKDAIVFTKNGGALSVGLLSQSYLEKIKAQAVIVPIVPFNQQNKNMIITEDSKPSLAAILQYSLFKTQEELFEEFDTITSKKGTRIIIWNIRRNKDGKPELDFETDPFDIRIPDIGSEESSVNQGKKTSLRPERLDQQIPESDYSLRAYCSILYLKPRMQIVLCKKKVKTQLITKSLAHIEHDVYKPSFSNKRVRITFGFNCKNKEHCGIMMYHRNRLMKSYEKVGCQNKSTSRACGIGVIGVIECNFLKPAHNKQNFDYTKEYRLTLQALGQKLNDYCKEKKAKEADSTGMIDEPRSSPDQPWVQCETCMKWRKLPPEVDPDSLPENWYCNMNPDSKFRDCSIPEEPEENDDEITPSYEKTFKKQDQNLEKKRRKSLDPEKLMLEAHSSGQRNSQWASAGQRRRGSEPGESEWEEDGGGTRSRSTSISTTSGYSDSVNEERVVSSSLRLRSNKRKPSSENNSVKQKWPKETAKEDPSEQPDTVVPKEDEMLLTEERLADSSADELIIIDGDDAPDMTQKVIQTIVKQEPETEAVEPPRLPEQGCNTELVKENSSDSKGPYGHIPVEELQISQGTQFIRKIEKSDNLFRDPNCSHLGQVAHGEALVQNVPEIDLDSTKKYAAATVHFLDNQLDRLRNLLDETAKERECFRNQNEAMLITIQRMEKQLVEYQQKPNQEELDEKGLECGSTEVVEDIRAGDPSLEEMKMHCQNMEQERDTLTQQLQDAVKRLESCSLEKDQLKGQLSELEQEREQLRSDYEKMKQDVKTSTKRGEDFYWTKKAAAAYRYSELELMRNEIGKLKGEKLSLEEKLNEAQQWIALQKEARVPSTSQECVQVNSALAKLKSLRINLGHLLACVLPHLDLRDINYETNSIDDILEKVIEENKL